MMRALSILASLSCLKSWHSVSRQILLNLLVVTNFLNDICLTGLFAIVFVALGLKRAGEAALTFLKEIVLVGMTCWRLIVFCPSFISRLSFELIWSIKLYLRFTKCCFLTLNILVEGFLFCSKFYWDVFEPNVRFWCFWVWHPWNGLDCLSIGFLRLKEFSSSLGFLCNGDAFIYESFLTLNLLNFPTVSSSDLIIIKFDWVLFSRDV